MGNTKKRHQVARQLVLLHENKYVGMSTRTDSITKFDFSTPVRRLYLPFYDDRCSATNVTDLAWKLIY